MEMYKSIFLGDFDAEVFMVIVGVLVAQVIDNPKFNNEVEQTFCADLLDVIGGTNSFDFCLEFLEDADRGKVKHLVQGLTKIDAAKKKSLENIFGSL